MDAKVAEVPTIKGMTTLSSETCAVAPVVVVAVARRSRTVAEIPARRLSQAHSAASSARALSKKKNKV